MTVNQDKREGFADAWSSKDDDDKFFYCDHSDARNGSTTPTCTTGPINPVAIGGRFVCGLSSQFTALAGDPQDSFTTTSNCLHQDQLSWQEEQKWRTVITTKPNGEYDICNQNGETRSVLLQVEEGAASMRQYQEVLFSHLLQQPHSSSPTGVAVGAQDFSLFSSHNAASQERDDKHHHESPKQHPQHDDSSLFHELSMLTPVSNKALQANDRLLPPHLSSSLVPCLLQGEEQSHKSSSQTPSPPPPPGFSSFIDLRSQELSHSSSESHGSRRRRGDSGSASSSGLVSCSSTESSNRFVNSCSSVLHGEAGTADASDNTKTATITCNHQPPRRVMLFELLDQKSLSPYQCLLRQQIELFEADHDDIDGITQLRRNQDRNGRQAVKKPIIVGQVGIRCIHCGSHSLSTPGATHFPTLQSMYRASKTMADRHLMHNCTNIPESTRQELIRVHLLENSIDSVRVQGGAHDWASAVLAAGIVQTVEKKLLFDDRLHISSPSPPTRPATGEWGYSENSTDAETCQAKHNERHRHHAPTRRLRGNRLDDSSLLQDLSMFTPATNIEALQHQNRLLLALLLEKLQSSSSVPALLHGGQHTGQLSCQTTAASQGLSPLLGSRLQKSFGAPGHRLSRGDSSSSLSCSSTESANTLIDSRSSVSHCVGIRLTDAVAGTRTAAVIGDHLPRRVMLFELLDQKSLSPYQCLLRQQIELFEADHDDIDGTTQLRRNQDRNGRRAVKKPIIVGQVGIRCIHCGSHSLSTPGATHFPTLQSMYRASKTMADRHLMHNCTNIPESTRQELIRAHLLESSIDSVRVVGSARTWASALLADGVVETDEKRLMFENRRNIPLQ